MLDSDTWAMRPEPHTTPELMGVRCDNCPQLSCIPVKGARLHPWRYYCEARHVEMKLKDMYAVTKADCPIHRDLRRRFDA